MIEDEYIRATAQQFYRIESWITGGVGFVAGAASASLVILAWSWLFQPGV